MSALSLRALDLNFEENGILIYSTGSSSPLLLSSALWAPLHRP